MKIAVDAMGGDHAPGVVIDGAVQAARDLGLELILVGRRDVIQAELDTYDTKDLALHIQHAEQVVAMDEHNPAAAIKASKDSSMVLGMEAVKRGEADAFVTAGHSGAALAAALFRLGRIRGIKRPALSTVFPSQTPQGHCFILDVGANADCKPEYLLQFAMMGTF
jgi:glycerol-3-phosphate acyltransferase PlsX